MHKIYFFLQNPDMKTFYNLGYFCSTNNFLVITGLIYELKLICLFICTCGKRVLYMAFTCVIRVISCVIHVFTCTCIRHVATCVIHVGRSAIHSSTTSLVPYRYRTVKLGIRPFDSSAAAT